MAEQNDDTAEGADDPRARMREALRKKQEKDKAAHGEEHRSGGGVGHSQNAASRREFRRKSGG